MSLQELAQEYGVGTAHVDGLGQHCEASEEALLSVLRALGVDIADASQAQECLQRKRAEEAPLVPPCLALDAWSESLVRLHGEAGARFDATLRREDGQETRLTAGFEELPAVDGAWGLHLGAMPPGYHTLEVCSGAQSETCHLLVAPKRAFGAPDGRREWGVFAPLHALRSEKGSGVGDLIGLGRMMRWAASLGASFFGCLPLLAANYREALETSPYSPVSRLFWNELYLDVGALSSRYGNAQTRKFENSEAYEEARKRFDDLGYVDYPGVSAHKRELLSMLSPLAWNKDIKQLEKHLRENPELRCYAQFRATMEKSGETWPQWERRQKSGELSTSDYDEETFRYFVFVQWAIEEQLRLLGDLDCKLYLDLSVGVSGSSYDVWRNQDCFVSGVDVGAPPDPLFEEGQNWALPPLHPQRCRADGHAYFAACVRNHMRHAGVLRIDHVMGLHRLYWVPSELGAKQGVYVQYPAEELYAILRIESHRQGCTLVGEDLGTVPDYVRPAMTESGIHRLYVGQFATQWREEEQHLGLETPPESAIASLDTHDTATFAGWFATTDLQVDPAVLMKSWTEELARGPAAGLMVTLEDLWLEMEPQNRPGTGQEVPNWRHRMVRSESQICQDPEIASWLASLNAMRRGES